MTRRLIVVAVLVAATTTACGGSDGPAAGAPPGTTAPTASPGASPSATAPSNDVTVSASPRAPAPAPPAPDLPRGAVTGGLDVCTTGVGKQQSISIWVDGPTARSSETKIGNVCGRWDLPEGAYLIGISGIAFGTKCALTTSVYRDDRRIRHSTVDLGDRGLPLWVNVADGQRTRVQWDRRCTS